MSTTPFLDSIEGITALDSHRTLASIEQLGNQIQQTWNRAQKLTFNDSYKNCTNVVVAGMGGSILGTHVIQTAFKSQLTVPITIAPDYTVPHFVDENTLVIASSYSGSTEETLAACHNAVAKGAQVTGITSGGKLSEYLSSLDAPHLVFPTEFNPSGSPRMGLGYSVFGQIALFAQLGLLPLTDSDVAAILEAVAAAHLESSIAVTQEKNKAKLLAFQLVNKLPVIVAAEHLEGAAHIFANQLNENAKTFAEYRVVPELNHHLLESFSFPDSAKDSLHFFTLHSEHYDPKNQRRLELTEELLEKNSLEFTTETVTGSTILMEVFSTITFAAYVAFYLAMINGVDPFPNPNVDWLKSKLTN